MRWAFRLGLGVIQIGLGAYIALRPMLPNHRVLTGQAWLDAAFAFFFMVRGAMNARARGVCGNRRGVDRACVGAVVRVC